MTRKFRTLALLLATAALVPIAAAQQDIITTAVGGGPNHVPAVDANIDSPIGITVDGAGNYYIAAYAQHRAFKVDTTGTLTVLAGTGIAGYAGDGIPGGAPSALLNGPTGIAVDSVGNFYIADYNSCVIRKVDTANTITTIAGVAGVCGYNGDGSPATGFRLNNPWNLTLDNAGNLYIADYNNCRVRKLVLGTGALSTYAGTGSCSSLGDGGAATAATLNHPAGVATDNAGNVYIADTLGYRIREVISATGIINTVAGIGSNGFNGDSGPAIAAKIGQVYGALAVDGAGTTVTIGESNNERIRQFTLGGNIFTIAGKGSTGFCGDGLPALQACFNQPQGLALGSGGSIYIADRYNNRIREFVSGNNMSTVAGNGSDTLPTPITGIPANGVVLNFPWGIWQDQSGNAYISDQNNCLVRKFVKSTNLVNIFAGTGVCGDSGDGGPATQANLNKTYGVSGDSAGKVYIADTLNHIIRKVDATGTISTFAGQPGLLGYSGDGGLATSAKLHSPYGISMDSTGNLYIADTSNHVIRKVTNGVITTIAGIGGAAGFLGDGDPATAAKLNTPNGVTSDAAGNVYIADTINCRIREIVASTGIINTVAGNGSCAFSGDGPAAAEALNRPDGVLADANGNLFIADTSNHRLRWVDTSGTMTTFAGNGTAAYSGDGAQAILASLYNPSGIAQDLAGNFLAADQFNFRVRGISAFSALNASAASLAFGVVPIGGTSTYQTLTLSAVGSLSISNITTTGDFSEFDSCGSGLANGKTCKVFVYFKPKTAGLRTGTLTIQDNGFFNQSTTIALTGSASALSLAGSPVAFDNQLANTTSAPKAVTITNKGTTPVKITAYTLTETTDFALASKTCPAAGQSLAAQASCVVNLVFKPHGTGLKKGALVITDNDPGSPQVAGLSGTGYSNVSLSPSSVVFPSQPVGSTTPASSAKKVTLTNNTGSTVTLATPAISITGPFGKLGATSCTNGLVIASGGTCSIYLVFSPTAVGYPTGTLTVIDSDVTSPQTVALSGISTGIQFAPSTVDFGASNVGNQVSSTVTVTNVGQTFVYFSAWSITGPNSKDFTTSAANPPCSGVLAPAAACILTMYFKPSAVGPESANFLLYDNSTGSPQVLPLNGIGQ